MIRPIAYIQSDYNEKFGIPRQAGLVNELKQVIVMEPEFADSDAVRGLEGFSHIWVIWGFSENTVDMTAEKVKWSATVRPPRLGGKRRMGVWATRAPYRPNSLGLSCVRLEGIDTGSGLKIIISGGDMMNGTPVFDIKPYIPYADCHPGASGGFTESRNEDGCEESAMIGQESEQGKGQEACTERELDKGLVTGASGGFTESRNEDGCEASDVYPGYDRLKTGATDVYLGYDRLKVEFPEHLLEQIEPDKREGLIRLLSLDPRGAYEKKTGYRYGLSFAEHDVRFTVENGILKVFDIKPGSAKGSAK